MTLTNGRDACAAAAAAARGAGPVVIVTVLLPVAIAGVASGCFHCSSKRATGQVVGMALSSSKPPSSFVDWMLL